EKSYTRANIIEAIAAKPASTYTEIELEADDIAVIMYTSGTTGKPKGVMLSHSNVIETAEIWSLSMNLVQSDRTFICTPLFHCAGSHVFAVPTMINGATLIVDEAFSPDHTLKALVDTRATIFFGVPAMYTILLSKPEMKTYSFDQLRLFGYGAAPMPYELTKQLKESFPNVKVQNFYGQTENSPATSTLLDEYALTKVGSVGKPLARTEIRLVDPNGEDVPQGEVGEICVKGPQVMQGYLRNSEETAKTIINDWLYSGDLGRFDEDGFLYIVDRKKDMIIRGGENIYPVEVEEVLYQIPQVLEAAIVGIPHEVYGEVPKAFVVLKPGESLTEQQVLDYCATQLAKYKLPYEVDFLEALPRNASGKVLKHTLRPKQMT
ncbi:MAG: AMP-binding protein, partial [Lysinibacillus sp.]